MNTTKTKTRKPRHFKPVVEIAPERTLERLDALARWNEEHLFDALAKPVADSRDTMARMILKLAEADGSAPRFISDLRWYGEHAMIACAASCVAQKVLTMWWKGCTIADLYDFVLDQLTSSTNGAVPSSTSPLANLENAATVKAWGEVAMAFRRYHERTIEIRREREALLACGA